MYGQESCTNLGLDTHIRRRISEPSAGFRWYFLSLTSKSVKLVPPESPWFMLDSGITPSIELKHLHQKIRILTMLEAVCKTYIRESLISSLYPSKSFLWYVPVLSFWALGVGRVLGFQRCLLSGIYLYDCLIRSLSENQLSMIVWIPTRIRHWGISLKKSWVGTVSFQYLKYLNVIQNFNCVIQN